MKSQHRVSTCFTRAILFLMAAAWSSTALAQSVAPATQTIVAGDYGVFVISGLNTSTGSPPTIVDLWSEYEDRVLVATGPIEQELTEDGSNYYGAIGFSALATKRLAGEVTPAPIDITLSWKDGWIFGSLTCSVTVSDPTFTFSPVAPAVRVGDTIALVVYRGPMFANGPLDFTLTSENSSVLKLGTTSAGPMAESISVSFSAREWRKTVYMSGVTMINGVTSTNIPVTARVGSYVATTTVMVVRNDGLILSPASATTVAGDALPMTITRTTMTNVSSLVVQLTADDPLTLLTPSTVTIEAQDQSANFSVVGLAPGSATIYASAQGITNIPFSVVTVSDPILTYSQNPITNTVGGARVVTINRPYNLAGGDLEISLVSLDPSFRVEPASVTIPAGNTSNATITVYGLSTGTGFLQASVGSFKTNLTVIVNDPSLSFSPGSVSTVVGDRRTVTVTRPTDENAVELVLNLSSLAPDIFSVSASTVTIPAGEQSATFEVIGLSGGSGSLAVYKGAYSANISVTVGAPSVGFLPAALTNTVGDVRVVTISRPLGEANADLNLTLSSLAPDVFSLGASSVLIPQGSISATVTVYGLTSGAGFLQARSGSYATNLPVTVNDPTITFSPTPTMTNTVGDARTLTISRSPGEAGANLSLNLSALAPDVFGLGAGNVTILAGNISATVTVYGLTSGAGFMEARVGSYATNLAVQVNSPVLTFAPVPLTNTVGDARTVSISRPLSQAGSSLSVTLASLAPGVFRLGSGNATILAGYASATVTVYGLTSGSGFLEARVGAYTTNLSVIVNDPILTFLPTPLTNTIGDAKTVTISRPFGQSGSSLDVVLSSLAPDLFSVSPASITIPAGGVSVDVTVYGLAEGSGLLQANAGSYGTNLAITVESPTLTFTPSPLTNRVGEVSTVTVRRPVSESGASLTIQLSTLSVDNFVLNASSLTIPAGQVSGDFLVLGLSSGSGTINASVSSYSTNLSVIVPPTTLALSGPVAVRVDEEGTMTLVRGGDALSTLAVTLSGTDSGMYLSVPASATIQAGQTSATFNITGVAVSTGVEVRASASGYPLASAMVPVIPTNPYLQYIVWRDVDASKTYNAGDTVTLSFNSTMATSTVTTANLPLMQLNASYAWIVSPTGSWGAGSTVAVADPGTFAKYVVTLAGAPVLGAGMAVDPAAGVTDVLGYPDTTVPPVYLPATEADSNTNGIPDWWEESYFGCIDCVNALGDPDGDGLDNLWEFTLNANPLDAYSLDGADAVKDGDWDSDGDTLINRLEIDEYDTDPAAADTDDDGWTDGQELDSSLTKNDWWRGRQLTSPTHSRSPLIQRSMRMTGTPVAIPDAEYLDRAEWMVDVWVQLTNSTSTGNLVVRKTDTGLTNFCLRVDNNVPTIEFQSPGGLTYAIDGTAIPVNLWTHLTGAWIPTYKSLELRQNDATFQAQMLASACAQGHGSATIGDIGLLGYLDKVVIRNPLPIDVVFVLDISGSMSGEPLAALKEAATLAIDTLPQDTPIGIVAFSDEATNLTQGFSTDKVKLKRIIKSLTTKNLTGYIAALECATNLVATYSTLDRHLEIFISDGQPNVPADAPSPSDELLNACANMGIVIDTIGFLLYDPEELQRLSDYTGGKYYDAPTAEDLEASFAGILAGLFKTRYLFDDGGVTAEDYERPLNWSNALSGVTFDTNHFVETSDIELGDTEPPQWWQTLFFGVNGCDPMGDTDKDGLINVYEYYSDTNPRDDDTDHDGVLDGAEDYDSDGLQNQDEQAHAADPRLTDTDDDNINDLAEKLAGTDPAHSLSPYFPRVLRFGGTANDYLSMPLESRFKLMSWTLEAWVNPASGWGGNGSVVYRDSEAGETNFCLGLDGSLRPVAGFGTNWVTGATAITNNSVTWTHLAATYDSAAQELKLFVNAVQVAMKVCSENPRASGIGPVIQRIGRGFNGMLDEVRIWNVSRSPESIESERDRSLSGNDPGLVAYYRFDDNTRWVASPTLIGTSGNNITNGTSAVDPAIRPWTWGQVEDFAAAFSKKDWTNRWTRAATINGNVSYSNAPGVTVQYPAVRVILQPVQAVGGGAGWSLNGGEWLDSGDVAALDDTNDLNVSIGYRSIYGWTEPTPETVELTNGMTRTLVRSYRMNGTLAVYLEPAEARSNGAMWRVDGGQWLPSDTVVSNVSLGAHSLDFITMDGWQEPALETVILAEGENMVVTKFYSAARGALVVNIEPAEARAAGAQWNVDYGGWQDSGVTNSLGPGNHVVAFRSLAEWTAPSSQLVAVVKGQTNTMTVTYQYGIRSVSGRVFNESLWNNLPPRSNPPGDGSGSGRIMVGAWLTSTEAYGSPLYQSLLATNVLPAYGSNYAYSINYLEPQPTWLGYQLRAWVDADGNGRYDIGEPASAVQVFDYVGDNIGGINVTIEDDLDSDNLPEWWEAHWFGNVGQNGNGDFDRDGLSNLQEYNLANGASGLASLNPADFDSDGDGMDDQWEVTYYTGGAGLSPTNDDAFADADGDGLSNIQEYNGVDGLPRIEQDMGQAWGIASTNQTSGDAINPLDIDTDGDDLVDSFEGTWYDVASGIDPNNAVAPTGMLAAVIVKADGTIVSNTTTLAGADPDQDGLTHYREQCLLAEFREGGSNDIWSAGASALPVANTNGVRAFSPPLLLGATNSATIAGDLAVLRGLEWTSPETEDTDDDLLPDGWEVEYNLDPKSAAGANGFWGDPDGDTLLNSQEYLGQDGNRLSARFYVNGSGDETNPNEHNWRPDSTGPGPGVMRPDIAADYWYNNEASPTNGTLGAALPTISLGADDGLDTDDDGIPDDVEIQIEYLNLGIDPSPVHSMSPFIKRAAQIESDAGIVIPDPEGAPSNYNPLLHKRDWTVECYVKLLATNMTGYLIDNPGPLGLGDISYRLSLTNNAPMIAFHTLGGMYYKVVGPALPTGKWIHLAGSWSQADNSLALYVDGVFVQADRIVEEALSSRLYGSMTPPVIGASADGTFAGNLLMDEIRIWGIARSGSQIETYRTKLVPQNSAGLLAYYRFDDGGTTAEDFARKAKNGLFGAASDDYLYGDFGYALRTNSFSFITNDYAMVRGVDVRGADDTDGDGMPDDWEMVNHLNPLSTNSVDGAWDDADGDGLVNIYEFWADTNPRDWDTDQNGIFDVNEDRDGDGVVNLTEQQLGSRPDIVDTDDDSLTDNQERGAGSNPAGATDPAVSRSVEFDGAPSDYLEVPISIRQRMVDWTIESWVNAESVAGGEGVIIRRVVQNLGGGVDAMNFILGVETNASGGLQFYTGYVLPSGIEYMIRGGTLPVGNWTHVAAVYNSANASLTLYTNGYYAVSSNGLYSAPPINGKGGETFVRIGEDFEGRVDELRVWDIVRTVTQIRTNYTKTVSESQTNLVHYFRFDDSQATTNIVAFNPYHQPHGAQDFTYPTDWMDEWMHAASLRGNVRFVEPGGVVPPPSLRINLQPAAAISDGAQWSLDGGGYNNSGVTLNNLSPGSHSVLYKSIYDWTAPSNEVLVLTNGVATTLTRTYLQNGSLTVSLEPLGAVSAGAQWRIDGGEWLNSGITLSNLSPVLHSVEFKPLNGWAEPVAESLTIAEGDHVSITRTYGESLALLQVTLVPTGAIAGGAQWNVNGGGWRDSGTNVALSSGLTTVGYREVPAWIGPSNETINLIANTTTILTRVYVQNATTDRDADGLLDAWEVMWFGNLDQTAEGDPDRDGLNNLAEFTASVIYTNLAAINPLNFDTDVDGMDDKWEYDRYLRGVGLSPCSNDAMHDFDGDGLMNVQEYNGMDGLPRLAQDVAEAAGIATSNQVSSDAINPLNIDTDGDGLVDSFEASWYDPILAVDPTNGVAPASITHITVVVPGVTNYTVDTTLAGSDPDADGLTGYREQCLLAEFSEGGALDIWSHGTNSLPPADANGVRAFSPPLLLGATNSTTIGGDIDALRVQEWTDPADGDTDLDLLPDGWEIEFNLDPKSAAGANGFYGDPDGDSLPNTEEYHGQDGLRATNMAFINGTGDETSPNEHNWRPDSTDVGPGMKRPAITNDYWYNNAASPTNGTLGAARPTTSLGFDDGLDTDDDGIPDNVELQQEYAALGIDPSPVHSMSPFIKRSMLITRASGVGIPDPEGAAFNWRALLHRSDFTIECYVKLLGANLTGFLVDNPGPLGVGDVTWRLGLTNNVPYVSFDTIGLYNYKVLGAALPTNRWIHLAGVWDAGDNSLSLYVDGIFVEEQRVVEPAMSGYLYTSASQPTIGSSANGSFSNRLLMDEIRIWGVARSPGQVEQYRTQLVPQNSSGLLAYYRFDDGGTTAEDFARKAQNGLFTAVSRNYTFGDFGYALRTNGFLFVTNDYAMVLGVDVRGADDTDGDGMPDDWEMVNHLDPLSTNGMNGAWADADEDGLVNIYEFWSDTNPNAESTDQDGELDVNEDRDGDGVANLVEQQLGSRPDIVDTDDDALDDNEERIAGSDPANANDPPVSRAVVFGGAAADYMEVPVSIRQRMTDWTLESWVKPDSVTGGVGTIVRRVVQNLGGGANAMNYVLGVETNASGSLRFYGGYVLTDGRQFFVRGGTVPTGLWSHAAISYDSLTSALLLYTNGAVAVSSNAQYSAPPINGKGGETFFRIGEDFQGQIDEVRVWNNVRAGGDVWANYSNTVSELQTNLVHYFRMDDGQAVTNRLPFSPFHQPHNAQDYTYGEDWMDQWKHAAIFHGSVRFFAPGVIQPPASLRVNLMPPAAVTDGAQWSFNGGDYNDSGVTLGNLPSGSNTVLYKSIGGWTAPSNEVVVLTNGAATTITRTYLQNGSLKVNIEPLAVVTAAQWRVDLGTWLYSGAVVTNLSPYSHTVEFRPIDGWLAPDATNITVVGAATQTITVTYGDSRGYLEVFLSPSNAVLAGARWSLDGGAWMNTGTNLVLVASGSHDLSYQTIPGWVTPSNETINIIAFVTTHVFRVYGGTDTDQDGLLDAWEIRWFGDLGYGPDDDPDNDGLTNLEEFNAAQVYAALDPLSPANFDSDGDIMDDMWEYYNYLSGVGLDPVVDDAMLDRDGDGLVNVQEYNGMDGWPRLMQDPFAALGVALDYEVSTDYLNPIDYDTDKDKMVDSFEAAWYDSGKGIDPLTTGTLFSADADNDGMSGYREQCLLVEFREGESDDIWSYGTNALPGMDIDGVYAFNPPLLLGATNSVTIIGDLATLQGQEWTDPSNSDTDDDGLPDGWETEFNLNPKSSVGADGFYGDPDVDTLLNSQEFLGQDGNRSTNNPNVNGTGDETNPNQHNWRPVSTGPGPGIMRPAVDWDYWYTYAESPTNGTLGAALPTASLGYDRGRDTDDDGIRDDVEIHQGYSGLGIDPSPVHSMSPFIKRSALIKRASGVEIPDPEGSPFNYSPLLHHRDWTIECYVKLLGTNMTGYLIDNPGPLGVGDMSYRMSLSNNVPVVAFNTLGGFCYKVVGPVLPTNRWIHLAGVFSHGNNSLDLYIDGVYFEAQVVTEESISSRTYASATPPVIGASVNGSFTNRLLMDEIRIWGIARTASEIEQYRRKLVPQDAFALLAYFRFDDGGTTAEDFTRKAQNGLLGADETDYFFGDFGYALRTNGFAFVTNDYATVLGVDERGADDTDGDGMPDDWETINHLDPLNVGTNGATADADGDGLWNIYEYWSDTNPHSPDSDQDGILDINEDRDGDSVANVLEQRLGSRPDNMDTDDDGLTDDVEQVNRTSPADATDPQIGRGMAFGGAAGDFLEIPTLFSQRLTDWSLEAWVYPYNAADGVGTILRRTVQKIGAAEYAVNYQIGLESDGAGGLRLYAGYVTPDGSNYVIRTMTNSIPVAQWTHVAATYNWNDSTLILYTNGAVAYREDSLSVTNPLVPAVATNFFISPPLNGEGGECFVRVGEDFGGYIDEVRLWNDTRGPDEVLQHQYTYFNYDAQGLIHNFNFDDSQANTNTFAFGQFHQPFGAQDVIYPKDWSNQWIHAAILRGSLQFVTNTAVTPPPSIRVILQPQSAIDAGAQWSVDGGIWRNSGETVQGLDRINPVHTIFYKTVDNWTAPNTESVSVSNGLTTVLNRTYVRRGALTVFVQPPQAIANALSLDGDDYLWSIGSYGTGRAKGGLIYHRSGDTITNLDVGTYILRFYPVSGWNPPASWSVDIAEGTHVIQVGQYTQVVASLTVVIGPQTAIDDGARWRVDSSAWLQSGSITNLDYGPHTVEFLSIPPWVTPLSQTVTVTNNAVFSITGIYTEVSGIYVSIGPDEAVTNGAAWRIVGETNYMPTETFRTLAPGSYTLQFRPLTGWLTPGNMVVGVQTGQTESITAIYLRSEILFTNLLNFLNRPRGLAFDAGHKLYIADSYNNRIVVYDTETGFITNWGGPASGSGLGQFYQPQAVAVDSSTNVFVADMHNNRIQRRSAASGTWTEWTGIGSPWDIALDWQTNLYIAEYYSNRVLKVTPAGVRSTFVSNGVADGMVRSPGGVTVDAYNNIVISDFPNNQGRIQQFGTNGVLIQRLGSSLVTEGGLGRPQNVQYAGCQGSLFVSDVGTNNDPLLQRSSDGTWQTVISEGTVQFVSGIAWDPSVGHLYVSDLDSNRVLRISLPTLADIPPTVSQTLATNGMVVTWGGVANWFYTVQYADSLVDPWVNLPGCVDVKAAYSSRFMSCIDTNYLIFPSRIYRMDNVHE